MLKKTLALILAIILCLSFAACSGGETGAGSNTSDASSVVTDSDNTESIVSTDDSSKTESTASTDNTSKPEDTSKPENTSKPEDTSKPENTSKPEDTDHKHTYKNDCDTTCDSCGETRTVTHKYKNDCAAICDVCYATRTPKDHVYANACDETCNSCGMKRATPHVYDNDCDEECNSCRKTRSTNHGKTFDAYGNCKSCGVYAGETGDVNGWDKITFSGSAPVYYRVPMGYNMMHNIKFSGGKSFNYKAYICSGGRYKEIELTTTPDEFISSDYIFLVITKKGSMNEVIFQIEETVK